MRYDSDDDNGGGVGGGDDDDDDDDDDWITGLSTSHVFKYAEYHFPGQQ